jgi:hypothetical protein
VEGLPSTEPQRLIRENTLAIREVLSSWSEDRRLALIKMLNLRTVLVVVSTPNLNSAHRIFSVMNSRGLDLSAAVARSSSTTS